MKALSTIGTLCLAAAALHLSQPSAYAGDKRGGGGVAGGGTSCSTASALILGDNPFTTAASTATLNVPGISGCEAHTMYKVNYFTFTPAVSSSYTFSLCVGTAWDSRLILMSTCSTSSLIACNDDNCSLQSRLSASLSAGTTYRIVVGGFGTTNGGPGVLNVAQGGNGGGGTGVIGPDLRIGGISDPTRYGSAVVEGQTIMAYSIGVTTCNDGDELADWYASPNFRHPYLTQNMYRIKGGRIEQIGMGWGRHTTSATQGNSCASCAAAPTNSQLGINCSDTLGGSTVGNQSGLGTRSEVDASLGIFPGTYNVGIPSAQAVIGRRLQVNANDLNPALNPSSLYVLEAQCLHAEDAARGNDNNNVSYRFAGVGALSGETYPIAGAGATVADPAIYAWKAADSLVNIVAADVPDDGRFILAYKVSQNENGTWHYEYAVQNVNSDRSGQSFTVPAPIGCIITNRYFHDVNYHSGDPYSSTDWNFTNLGGTASWAGGTFAQNPNNNALRFGTLYNFAFDASTAPVNGSASIRLFKPGSSNASNTVSFSAMVPSAPENPSDLNLDGVVNAQDLAILLSNWGGFGIGDLNGDGIVDSADIAILLNSWTIIVQGDLNSDGFVNASDLAILLGNWGGSGVGDLNGDGTVDSADIAILLNNWS